MSERRCLHCGRELGPDVHGLRRYCPGACYGAAADARSRRNRGIDPTAPKRAYMRVHASGAVGVGILSFEEIGRALGLSHEAVRAAYLAGIAKLENHESISRLRALAADLQAARDTRLRESAQPYRNAQSPAAN
jgi:hypothetical protein